MKETRAWYYQKRGPRLVYKAARYTHGKYATGETWSRGRLDHGYYCQREEPARAHSDPWYDDALSLLLPNTV